MKTKCWNYNRSKISYIFEGNFDILFASKNTRNSSLQKKKAWAFSVQVLSKLKANEQASDCMQRKMQHVFSSNGFSLCFCTCTGYLLSKTWSIFLETFHLSSVSTISMVTFHFSVFHFTSFTLKYKSWLLVRKDTVQVSYSGLGYFNWRHVLSANTIDLIIFIHRDPVVFFAFWFLKNF